MCRTMRILTSINWDRVFVALFGAAIFASLAFPDATLLDLAIGALLAGLLEWHQVRRAR